MSSILKSRVGTRPAGASFAENFYGIKRRRAPLFKTDRARSAVGGVFPEETLEKAPLLSEADRDIIVDVTGWMSIMNYLMLV